MLPIQNVTYVKYYKICYLYEMLPIRNVTNTKCYQCKMLPIINVTNTKCLYHQYKMLPMRYYTKMYQTNVIDPIFLRNSNLTLKINFFFHSIHLKVEKIGIPLKRRNNFRNTERPISY